MTSELEFDLEHLGYSDFESCVSESWLLLRPEGDVPLILNSVKMLKSGTRTGGSFSLLFSGPKEPLLEQDIHRLQDGESKAMDVFLVPVGQTSDATLYEVIFN